jgi:hypothetical protein
MRSIRNQRLPLKLRVDRVGQHIVRARLFLDLWFYFESEDTRPKIIGTMEEYNAFFRFTPHAYLATYMLYMSGVFDKAKGTINIASLLREAAAAGYLPKQDDTLEEALTRAKPIADKVAILRHNAFAHRSAYHTYNDVFDLAAVTPDELHELTVIALKIANRLLSACGLQEQHFTKLPRDAAKAMMRTLGQKSGPHRETTIV